MSYGQADNLSKTKKEQKVTDSVTDWTRQLSYLGPIKTIINNMAFVHLSILTGSFQTLEKSI